MTEDDLQPIPEPEDIFQAPLEHVDVRISLQELEVLKRLLERDRTAREAHGGLKVLLGFTDDELATLLGFLDRI